MSNTITVKWFIETDRLDSRVSGEEEFSKVDWDLMDDKEREDEMRDIAFQHMSWSYGVKDV